MNYCNTSKVLICIPTYNTQEEIILSLKSILTQTYKNLEVIVVDNASTDDTVKNVDQYRTTHPRGNLIRIIQNPTNLGRISNWNKCLKIFKGSDAQYVKFIFAGDFLEPECLNKQIEVFINNDTVGLVTSGYNFVENNRISPIFTLGDSQLVIPIRALEYSVTIGNWFGGTTSCYLIKKDALGDVEFDEAFTWVADWKLCLDIAKNHESYYIHEVLTNFNLQSRGHYRRHSNTVRAKVEDAMIRIHAVDLLREQGIDDGKTTQMIQNIALRHRYTLMPMPLFIRKFVARLRKMFK